MALSSFALRFGSSKKRNERRWGGFSSFRVL
ncbi:hypothetical protein COLO4_23258 [Corchorus olitorius]|uniref:Uncharacterized protein n=1 Tax=Corchorus olitorius TaxID=93759 RepID=A0A1R3IHJ2_9ROSI|nr:hypothetical protein COLO4_23258 [Corchorus olitorius]